MLKYPKHYLSFFCILLLCVFWGDISLKAETKNSFDVDLVYLWCDGEDPAFVARKNKWLEKENSPLSKESVAEGRFVQVDELKYSLRSVEKYLPWIHHIYIVTDRQVPKWLNTEHPKITIVDHSKIIPKKYLPIFNSNAIESAIYRIPGLSEHFLYANDDMFINRPLDKSFFFKDGKVVVRIKSRPINRGGVYHRMLSNAFSLMERDFGKIPVFSDGGWEPHHNIDAYLKSDYAACAEHYNKEYTKTLNHRFRQKTSVQRVIVSVWSFIKGHVELKEIKEEENIDSLLMKNGIKDYLKRIRKYNPGLFCINDTQFSIQDDRIRTKGFLESYFPKKSEFEK